VTFGLTIEKLLLIGLIAVMIIGPERLPAAAESLRRTIQQVRRMARTAQERVREELGPEVVDVDWQRLDPRQYDPRRIIREALLAEPDAPPAPGPTTAASNAAESGEPAPSAMTIPVEAAPATATASAPARVGTAPPP
jgi:sec-independent protein translocase protein TatB